MSLEKNNKMFRPDKFIQAPEYSGRIPGIAPASESASIPDINTMNANYSAMREMGVASMSGLLGMGSDIPVTIEDDSEPTGHDRVRQHFANRAVNTATEITESPKPEVSEVLPQMVSYEVTEEPVELPKPVKKKEIKMEQETVQQQEEQEVQAAMDIYEILESKGGPTKDEIEEWKQAHGDVQMLAIDENNLYIYRPMKRAEWQQLQAEVVGNEKITAAQEEEMIVSKCMLFPKIDVGGCTWLPAGLVPTLARAVMNASMFLTEEAIMSMAIRL